MQPATPTPKRGRAPTVKVPKSPLAAEIVSLAGLAIGTRDAGKSELTVAISAAHRCGALILKEKKWFESHPISKKHRNALGEIVQGEKWSTWFDSKIKPSLPPEAAKAFTRLAKRHEGQRSFTFDRDPNVIRSGVLALGIFPRKKHAKVEGDLSFPKVAKHHEIVNRLVAFERELASKTGGSLNDNQRGRLLADFAPIASFLDRLRNPRA